MKQILCFAIAGVVASTQLHAQQPATPDKIYGTLFHDIQMQKVYADGKTFVDCLPKRKPADIMYDYGLMKGPAFDLKKFAEANFTLPVVPQLNYIAQEKDVEAHIKNLWSVLKREADKPVEGSSLLPLPNPYIVPGGRFREIYYWDSYFTMLGLKESGETAIIESMIKNFAYLIDTYGHIPNGNRTYYVSRSQPPFFATMVELLATIKGNAVYITYLPQLEKEYNYWMEGAAKTTAGKAYKRIVRLKDGTLLNRYWDESDLPRQESYREDVETAEKAAMELASRIRMSSPEALNKMLDEKRKTTYHHLRAGAASGWDFSSRWFADGKTIATIQTTAIIPVDLNSLLYKMEMVIALAKQLKKDAAGATSFKKKALIRAAAINKYCWSKQLGFYTDYNFETRQQNQQVTAAGAFPFFVFETNNAVLKLQAKQAAGVIKANLLQDGGILTTTIKTGQQWDAPNGWAPLQWVTITAMDRFGQNNFAKDIASRWIKLNTAVYQRTGKLMEKYNVVDIHLDAGGGEYPSQDGFGWTNGVLLALIKKYGVQ